MRKKFKLIIGDETYLVGELTVGLYWLFFEDIEQFIEELFLEFNSVVPVVENDQLITLLDELFYKKEDDLFENIFSKKKRNNSNNIQDFHILVGKFMKYYGSSYTDTMKVPLSIFNDLLIDYKVVSGEQEYSKNRHSDKPEKNKLKKLLANT